jgi:hypothetical protein
VVNNVSEGSAIYVFRIVAVISLSVLHDRSIASSKACYPQTAIGSFQFPEFSRFLKVIQCLLRPYSSSSCHFDPSFYLSLSNVLQKAVPTHSVQNLLSSRLLSKNTKISVYRTIILPVVLYGCETWSLTLREEQRLRVFENRVLRIFGPKRDEVTGEWRRPHNEELNDLYSSPNTIRVIKSRRMRRAGHVAHMGEKRGAYRILVGRPEGR